MTFEQEKDKFGRVTDFEPNFTDSEIQVGSSALYALVRLVKGTTKRLARLLMRL
jgi:hypothetical protein